jgi:hypothetical protein
MRTRYIQLYDAPFGGDVRIYLDLRPSWSMNKGAVFRQTWESVTIYCEDGTKLQPHPSNSEALPQRNLLSAVSAFFYDPPRDIEFRYEPVGSFDLQEVKGKILEYVAEDDDILTQFLDGDRIRELLDKSSSFADIVNVIELIKGAAESPHA